MKKPPSTRGLAAPRLLLEDAILGADAGPPTPADALKAVEALLDLLQAILDVPTLYARHGARVRALRAGCEALRAGHRHEQVAQAILARPAKAAVQPSARAWRRR